MEQTNNNIVAKEGWSWGAPMFNAGFLIGVKQYKLLWWYLFAIVPILNIIFGIAFWIYLGIHGHRIAARGNQFANQSEYDGFMKAMDHAGKIIFFAAVIVLAIIGAVLISVFVFAPHWMNHHPSSTSYQNSY